MTAGPAWDAGGYAARRALLERLLALPPAARPAALDAAAGDDAALRSDVAALLAAAEDPADDAGPPAGTLARAVEAGAAAALAEATPPARTVGPWTILEKIGEGGMGVVWKAQQRRPSRLAALKFLRLASATPDATRRLELEAEVLAHLEHPSIAKLYEVGTLEGPGGPQPYLALEFVDGEPLDAWVARRDPPRAERLRLFLELCAAVEHAHGQGVIHRDLKPSNVLVRRDGRLKVLDFGIARMTGGAAPQATPGTRADAVLGTLAWMAPERVAGAPADARSDVYALGAILFEVLSGRLPLDVTGDPLPRALERIALEEPPRLGGLDPSLAGDLETIAATALAKEPGRRYATAAALADDVRRHLQHEPVRARAPSPWYVMSRFARRHRTAVTLLLAAAAGLVVTAVLALAAADRADTERGRAESARAAADATADRAERDAYRARLAAAVLELGAGDARAAAASLEAAPAARRGWEWDHLASRLDESLRTFGSVGEAVLDAAFAADPDHLVLVVRARDGRTPASVRTVRWRDGAVVAERPTAGTAALSADATTVAEGDDAGHGRLVSVGGEALGSFSAPGDGLVVRPAAVAPDGSGAVFAVIDGPAKLRSLHVLRRGGTTAQRLGNSGVEAELSPGSRRVVWLHRPNAWAVTDLGSGTLEPLGLGGSLVRPLGFDFSPDGRRLLAATTLGWLHWDVEALGSPVVGPEEAGTLTAATWLPDGQRAAFVARNGAVRVWDLGRRELVRTLGGQREVPSGGSCRIRPGPGGRLLSSDGTGYVRLWDDERSGVTSAPAVHTGYVYAAAASPDGARVATVGWDGVLGIVDPVTGRVAALHRRPAGSLLLDVAWSPDGRRLAVLEAPPAGKEHVVLQLDARTLAPVGGPASVRLGTALPFGGPFLRLLAYRPSTGALFVAGVDGLFAVDRDRVDARPAAKAPATAPWARRTAQRTAVLAARGDRLVRMPHDGRLELRGGPDGELERVLETGVEGACELVLDAAASTAYVGTLGGGLARVDLATGAVRRVGDAAVGAVYAVALAEADRRLFTGGEDGRVRVWSLPDLEPVTDLRGHRSYVHALALAAHGRVLVSGGGDNTVRLWSTVPASRRVAAAAEDAARRAAVAPRVEAALAAHGDAARAADALASDTTLTPAEREAALDLVRAGASAPR